MANSLFRLMLALHPREFRDRFSEEMLDLYRQRRAAAAERGVGARVWLAARTVFDGLRSAVRERRRSTRQVTSGFSRATGLRDDVRTAVRRMRRSPALSVTVVALMALTIGSATAVFSVVNAVLLKPLPFGDPDRLVVVWETRLNALENGVGAHEFPKWERRATTFQRMAAIIYNDSAHLTGAGEPTSVLAMRVSAGFFDVMDVRPAVGRAFTAADDTPGAPKVAVLSDRIWRGRFGASAAVLGTTVRVNGSPIEVVGIMPPGFAFPPSGGGDVPDIWTPIAEDIEPYAGRHYLFVMARLKPGVTLEQAQADMTAVAATVEQEMPTFSHGHGARIVRLHDHLVKAARPSLRLLFGAVIGLVLIGCGNVAGLLFARSIMRRREVALEMALGAPAWRVARQVLFESVLMSVSGGALGLVGATWLTWLLPALVPAGVIALDAVRLDPTVLGFALGLSVLTGLVFGAAPTWHLRRTEWATAVRGAGRAYTSGDQPLFRRALVATQIAVAVLLVIGAGLMARGFVALQHVDPGYRTGGLLAVDLSLRGQRYAKPSDSRQFFDELTTVLRGTPGVTGVGATDNLPLSGGMSGIAIAIEGRPPANPGDEPAGQYRIVSPGYFETMGVSVLEGRTFASSDARIAVPLIRWWAEQPQPAGADKPQAPPVAVINRTMADRYWPAESPIGRRFTVLFSPMITVVGVVADARNATLRNAPGPEFYLSSQQEPTASMSVLLRTSEEPAAIGPAVRDAVRRLDRALPIVSMRPMEALRGHLLGAPRFMSLLLGGFAAIALVLMSAGVYGLVAFMTALRRPEIGIRLALGARRTQVAGLVIGEGAMVAAAGLAIGIAGAALGGRLIADELYGVTPTDLATFVVVPTVVFAVVLLACWLPARRASRVDPIVVLRQE